MSDSKPRGRGRPRQPAVDEAILDAALELFIDGGFEGATIERIAARAGVMRPTVYRRWPNREALLVDAVARVRTAAEASLTRAAPTPNLEDVSMWMLEAIPRSLARPRARKLIARLIGAAPDHPKLLERYWERVLGPRWAAFARLFEAAGGKDGELLSDVVAGALTWHLLVRPGEKSPAQVRAFLKGVLDRVGLAAAARTTAKRSAPKR